MIRRSTIASVVLIALCVLLAFSAPPALAKKPRVPRGKTWVVDFRADTLGIAPSGSVVMSGDWAVLEDSSAVSAGGAPESSTPGAEGAPSAAAPRLLRQRASDEAAASNWLHFTKPSLERCEVSVSYRVVSGELDPGIGILFQYDPKRKNGYLVRISGAEGEISAHYLLLGRRRDITMKKIEVPPAGSWHTFGVRRDGVTITVLSDGKEVMTFRDERYTRGGVGLWTEDDTVADFRDLRITAR